MLISSEAGSGGRIHWKEDERIIGNDENVPWFIVMAAKLIGQAYLTLH